ncbi:uncharacterized protein LOC122363499 [Amphibalanus amphitrite]|uniref:uncharacterized protein LOC122363499 n=1 Tax=Amphibalanus amphitrite TaxID=1232801 RepID=UPI001C924E2B|nr:uncharacterized protein LOC122363499 [Amphibalanus amphitrite]
MDGRDKARSSPSKAWTSREGTPLRSLPGFTVPTVETAPSGRPSFYLSHPQLESAQSWFAAGPRSARDYDAESGGASSGSEDADSISSSTGGLFTTISVPTPKQPMKKSLSPTPSFTYIDAKAAMAARKQTVSCCASKSVLKITLTFCVSFLLGMILTVIYMEVYLWRRR